MFGGPPSGGGGGGPPPMLPPLMAGAPQFPVPPVDNRLPSAAPPPPVVVTMDFDYDDDKPLATDEAAISDAKRRRLEQERRANETAPNPLDEIVRQVEPLLNDPERLFATIQSSGLTMSELINLLTPHPGTKQLVMQLTAIARQREFAPRPPEEQMLEQEEGLEQVIGGIAYYVRMSTTVYVGNITHETTEEQIRTLFAPYGQIHSISHIPHKGVSFVTFANRSDAEVAQLSVNGNTLNGQILKTAWARGPGMKAGEFDKYTGRAMIPKDPVAYQAYLATNPPPRGRGRGRGFQEGNNYNSNNNNYNNGRGQFDGGGRGRGYPGHDDRFYDPMETRK